MYITNIDTPKFRAQDSLVTTVVELEDRWETELLTRCPSLCICLLDEKQPGKNRCIDCEGLAREYGLDEDSDVHLVQDSTTGQFHFVPGPLCTECRIPTGYSDGTGHICDHCGSALRGCSCYVSDDVPF